jgi:hypothetical protein
VRCEFTVHREFMGMSLDFWMNLDLDGWSLE